MTSQLFYALILLILSSLVAVTHSIAPKAEDVEKFCSSAREGNLDNLKLLLDSKAVTIHSRDSKGNTALIIASGRGKVDAIKLLLHYGANPEDATHHGLFEGKSALSWACSQGKKNHSI
jgi:ankyrin repeat protein